MGLYDRSYYQDEQQPSGPLLAGQPMFVLLIVINVIIFFADFLFGGQDRAITMLCAIDDKTILQPWLWWKALTYGFVHSPDSLRHLAFNMIGLFFFGRAVEQRLGRMEFLRFYLVAIVFGGIVFSALHQAMGDPALAIGASGAVIAVTMLFIFWYPNQELLFFFVLPVKAWVVGVFLIVSNFIGVGGEEIAFDIHLAGIAFGAAYYYFKWNLGFLAMPWLAGVFKPGPRLKLHDPDRPSRREQKDAGEVDRILKKIHDSGEESLTNAERKTLERHSRRLREKR